MLLQPYSASAPCSAPFLRTSSFNFELVYYKPQNDSDTQEVEEEPFEQGLL